MGRWIAISAPTGKQETKEAEANVRANEQKLKGILEKIAPSDGAIVVIGTQLLKQTQLDKSAEEAKKLLERFVQCNFAGLDNERKLFAYRSDCISEAEAARMCAEHPIEKVWIFCGNETPSVEVVEW